MMQALAVAVKQGGLLVVEQGTHSSDVFGGPLNIDRHWYLTEGEGGVDGSHVETLQLESPMSS